MLRAGIFRLGFAKVKDIYRVVGLSCKGFEEELMALLIAIEASCSQMKMDSTAISKTGK